MPVITNDSEKKEWLESLKECIQNTDISKYYAENEGAIENFGININGYLKVGFESETPELVNDSIIDEIFIVINQNCEQKNIQNIPVVFI